MRFKKFIKIVFVFLILFFMTKIVVYASDPGYGDINQFDNYTSQGTNFQIVDNAITITAGVILDVIRVIIFCIGLLLLIIIGIKYTISTPEIKAELKKSMPAYFLGVIILFGASGILKFITYIVQDAF